jgi:hypothetical protein
MNKQELESLLQEGGRATDTGPIEEHLRALANERQLPDFAIAMCTVRFEESGPALRAVLARAAEGVTLAEDEARLLFRGLYILGGARDAQAWPLLRRLLHRPRDDLDNLLGDAITESLARIVVGVFDGDADVLFDEIADRSLDEFTREALIKAASFLAWEGRIDRESMRAFMERFCRERLAEDGDFAWVGWLEAIARLGWRHLAPLVKSAWDDGRIPDGVLEWKHFEADLATAEGAPNDAARFNHDNVGYIEDVIEALDWTRGLESVGEEGPEADAGWGTSRATFAPGPAVPVTNPWRHVGRNDPCPCGSGKKAKKCCLAH